ncbi:MAG: hypothetical protein H6R13_3935 [Proteobacteria bacterium]|jgi:predicted solute-binding protein|nr:hypothetical protein [Pseudomonadota bacterium]
MKIAHLLIALPLVFAITACEQKPPATSEQIKDKVNDALESRPNEKLKDAAEDIRDGAKAAAKDLKEATK